MKEGDQPTHTLTSYYRPEHVEGTRIVDPTPGPAGRGGGYRVLYDAGYEIDHMKESLFARTPTADEVKLLQLPPSEPVVELHRTTYTADGTAAIGLGSHDLGVADAAVDPYKRGMAPLLVFTGATNPTTPNACPAVKPCTTASGRSNSASPTRR